MAASAPDHRSRVLASPWPGVHSTDIASARRFGRHWHATHGIGLLLQGAQHSASGRGPVDAYAGELITTNPGEVHDGRPLGATRHWRMLYFEPGVLADWAGPAAREFEFAGPVLRDPPLADALRALFAAWDAPAGAACGWRVIEETLLRIGARLAVRHAAAPMAASGPGPLPVDAALRRVRDRLADECAAAPSLAELAEMCGLSRYQLLRRYERAFGVPPHAWLLQQRAERARQRIRDGASLAEAAADGGFADQSHLHRVFVRQFGVTPGTWRQAFARPQ